jgi:hypothetical protein
MVSLFSGYHHLARLLIESFHVDLNAKNINGDTPLHFAGEPPDPPFLCLPQSLARLTVLARSCDRNFLSYLLTKRPEISELNIWGDTAISIALEGGIDLEAMTPLEPDHLLRTYSRERREEKGETR